MEGEEPDNIWIAVSNGDFERVQHLVGQEGVSVNVQDEMGYSPLHAASSYGEMGILEFLVSLGADVNIRDNDGDTPLLVAETPAAFEALVQSGADPQAKNKAGEGIVEKVIEEERPELFEYLVERGFVTDGNLIAQVRAALQGAGEDTGGIGFEVINEGDEENEDEEGMQM